MTTQTQQLDDLFQRWSYQYPQPHRARFIKDGIIEQARWDQIGPGKRILFLLKDANLGETGSGNHDFRQWVREKPWKELGYWAYGLRYTNTLYMPSFEEAEQVCDEECLASAVLNLKKSGGIGVADDNDISDVVKKEWHLIEEELDIIKPDFVVCGGTWDFIDKRLLGLSDAGAKLFGHAYGALWIKHCHPSARVNSRVKYYGLSALYQKILQEKRSGQRSAED